jgi:hypothetical protein
MTVDLVFLDSLYRASSRGEPSLPNLAGRIRRGVKAVTGGGQKGIHLFEEKSSMFSGITTEEKNQFFCFFSCS